jgi:hypothetical protein
MMAQSEDGVKEAERGDAEGSEASTGLAGG